MAIFTNNIKENGLTAIQDILKAISYIDFFKFEEINIRIKAILELIWPTGQAYL